MLSFAAFAVLGFSVFDGWTHFRPDDLPQREEVVYEEEMATATPYLAPAAISAVFTPEVQYWAQDIIVWSQEYQLDPNLVATVIQIESCGDPNAVSPSGAIGLFQVMPFHFVEGEIPLEPATNAQRGLAYLVDTLDQANGHVGLALAGYNGGPSAIEQGWDSWSAETRSYFRWGSGIYREVSSGWHASPTLEAWLQSGGASLCEQAAQSQAALEVGLASEGS
jgi:soluble lytic murein transglycosylase-like protein